MRDFVFLGEVRHTMNFSQKGNEVINLSEITRKRDFAFYAILEDAKAVN